MYVNINRYYKIYYKYPPSIIYLPRANARKKRKEKKEKSFGTPLFRDVPRDAIKYMFASFDIESSN